MNKRSVLRMNQEHSVNVSKVGLLIDLLFERNGDDQLIYLSLQVGEHGLYM